MDNVLKYMTVLFVFLSTSAIAAPVDLSSWAADGGGTWTLQAGNDSVLQSINGDPAVFYNGVNSQGNQLSGEITVQVTGDDDYIGFVLGYNGGDVNNNASDYLLIDWKQSDQGGFFGGTALEGLAISRVTDVLIEGAGAWLHSSAHGVEELQRATNLGSTGWLDQTTYAFDLIFTSSLVEVFVDGTKELSVAGSFNDGSFGFYNYSQSDVLYAGITQAIVQPTQPPSLIPEPMSILLMNIGIVGMMISRRKKPE